MADARGNKRNTRFQVKPEEVKTGAKFTFVTVIEQVGGWEAWSAIHDLIDAKFPSAAKEYERQHGPDGHVNERPGDRGDGKGVLDFGGDGSEICG